MLPRKTRQKSPSTSSVDSGLGHSTKKKLSDKPTMNKEVNYSQQLLQAANLTAKTQLLKKGLMNSNEKFRGFMNEISPLNNSENESDSENMTGLKFSPSACSTQHVKKSESTSESSGEDEFTTERTIRVKRNSSTDSEAGLSTVNEVIISNKPISQSNIKSKKKSKINILGNQLILSDSKDEADSDSKSVVPIHKSISSYSVSSEIDSEEEMPKIKLKNEMKNVQSLNTNKAYRKNSVVKSIGKIGSKDSDSNDQEKNNVPSVDFKSKSSNSQKRINKKPGNDSDMIDSENVISRKSKVKKYDAGRNGVKNFQTKVTSDCCQNNNLKSSLQHNDISSSESESSEKRSQNESDSDEPVESKSKHKILNKTSTVLENMFNKNEDYKKLPIPQKADLADLDSDDEIYLLQIPKSINPKMMEGISFSLSRKSKLRMDSGKYVIKQQSDCQSSILTYSNSLKVLRPLATLKMEKHLKTKGQDEIVVEEKKMQPLPNNIKIRHPLFGSDYESKIQLEEQIKEKLEQALQRFQVKKKTPKRKKKPKEYEEDKNHLISKILEEKFGNVSKLSIKNRSIEPSSPNRTSELNVIKTEFFNGNKQIIDVKNKKNKSRSFETFENTDPKITIKTEVQDPMYFSSILEDESLSKKKKKRKQLSETQELTLDLSNHLESTSGNCNNIKREIDEPVEATFVKQEFESEINNRSKRKRKNIISEKGDFIDSQFLNEISKDSFRGKKEKKRGSKKVEELEEILETELEIEGSEDNQIRRRKYNVTEEVESSKIEEELTSVKKKKNKKTEIKKGFYVNEEVESDGEPLKKKKKKKKLEYTIEESIKKEPYEEFPIVNQKKRRKSILSSTKIFENLDTSEFKIDISKIEGEESVVKKNNSVSQIQDSNDNHNLISSLLFSVKNRLESTSDKNKISKRKPS